MGSFLPPQEVYGIGAVAIAAGWLIWKLVILMVNKQQENTKQLLEIHEKTLDTLSQVKNSIEANTKMTEATQQAMTDSNDKILKMVTKILKNGNKK